MNEITPSAATSEATATRQPWVAPRVQDLPRLSELTLLTGPGIPGEGEIGGGSGSTVFA
jgi:hypothetical protein